MIKIAICDDDNIVVSQIETLILDICKKEIAVDIDTFYSGQSLEQEVLKGIKYDLIYLDIQMKDGDGIGAAKSIRQVDDTALLIYVSGYDKYMIELFQLDVFKFIQKPIDPKIFAEVFLNANKRICNNHFYFFFSYKSVEYKLLCRDILYFQSSGRQIQIHSRNDRVDIFNGKLSDVEAQLSEGKVPFLRIHQSYLVNYYHIDARTKVGVILSNEEILPISEERQKEFGRQYGKLLGNDVYV